MKTWLASISLGFLAVTAFGQGTVFFSTKITPLVDARIFDVDGTTPLSGAAYLAQIYGGPSASQLKPAGDPLPFRSDAGNGYVDNRNDPSGGIRTIPDVPEQRTAYVQVRAWEAAKGSTFEAAQAAGGKHGSSGVITLVTGGGVLVPPNLIGLQGFKLQLSSRPTIVTQPRPVVTGLGGSVRFEVTAGGSSPFEYQWKHDGNTLSGARSRTYEIAKVESQHAGSYSVRVSNAFGFVDSDPAQLTIAPLPVITEVLINPATPLLGRPMRLEVLVQNASGLAFQWRRNNADIPGATQSQFEDATADAGAYSLRVTGPGGTLLRDIVTVSPNYALSLVPLGGGSIEATPSGAYHPAGTTVSLRAVPDNGYLFKSWNGSVTGSANPVSLVMNDHKSVEAVFTPVGGTVYFVNRNLGLGLDARVLDTDGVTPVSGASFVAQLYAGPTAEALAPIGPTSPFLTAEAAGYFRGEDRSIASVRPGDVAYVQIRAWDTSAGSTYEAARQAGGKHGSNPAIPVVTGNLGDPPSIPTIPRAWTSFKLQLGSSPLITAQPRSLRIGVGSTARFEVQATGSEPLAYQWRKGTSDIDGAKGRTYEIPNVTTAAEGSYSVRVSNSHGFAVSDPATLQVATVHALALTSSGDGTVVATPEASDGFDPGFYLPGTVVMLQAIPDGSATFVRWEGSLTGSVNPTTLTMNAAKSVTAVFQDAGNGGTVDFRNFGGGIDAPIFDTDGTTRLSGPAFLAQLYAGPSEARLEPVGAAVPFRTDAGAGYLDNRGGSLRVVPTVRPGERVFLQIRAWDAAQGETFEVAVDAGARTGISSVISVTAGGGLATPALPVGLQSFHLELPTPPRIRVEPQPVLVGLGARARFEVTADGTQPISYQWFKGTQPIDGARSRLLELAAVAATDAGSYFVRVSNPFGHVDSKTVTLTLAPLPAIAGISVSPNPARVGQPLRLEVTMADAGPFTFQWRRDQSDLPGATSALLELTSAQAGTYSVRVLGAGGFVTQDAVTVSPEYILETIVLRGGTVTTNPDHDTYPAGTRVVLTAVAEPGYQFSHWTGDATGSDPAVTVILNDHRQVEAVFNPTGGTVYFVNRNLGLGIDAPVYDEGGTALLDGPGFVAQLYAGPTASSLAPVGRPIPFLTGEGAGYFRGEDRSIPTVPPGGQAHLQIRAWDLAAGDTYEAAATARGKHGAGNVVTVTTGNLGNPPTIPAFLVGVASFQLRRGTPPIIDLVSPSLVVLAGDPAELAIVASGTAPLSYQWFAGIAGTTTSPVGTSSPNFVSEPLLVSTSFWVRVSNPYGTVDSVTLPVVVERRSQVLTFLPLSPISFGSGPLELSATASSGLPVTFTRISGRADLDGTTLTPTGVGSVVVRATQPGNDTFLPAPPVEQTLAVTPARQSITFAVDSPRTFGDPPSSLTATASSGLPVVLELLGGPGTLAGSQLTYTGAGTLLLRASQPGDARFLPAEPVERSVVVQKASAILSFTRLSQTFDGSPKHPDVAVRPPGLLVTTTIAGSSTPPSAVGEYTVQATVDDPNYAGSASATFQIVADVNLAGVVFDDTNGSGTQDPGEGGLSGVHLRLLGLDGTTELRTTTSGADGSYSFSGVATASYYLEELNPTGFVSTTPDLRLVSLSPGTLSRVHFGDQAVATIAGSVFEDLDADGFRDDSENGLAGVSVRLVGDDGQRTTTTTADGSFQFQNLNPGPYTIEETDPVGFFSTTPNLRNVSVSPGGAASASFGDQAAGSVGGTVFEDRNGNGSPDESEIGIPNVAIRLSDGASQRSTRTDADGRYRFGDVQPGTYTVEEIDPLGFTSTTANLRTVAFGSGGSATAHFGDQPEATVGGVVFLDLDGNGRQDSSESGIADAVVRLIGTAGQRSTATDANGNYLFANVAPGTYSVEETDPVGYSSSTPNTRAVNVASGGAAIANFGDQVLASIGGVVFEDLNGNGSFDDGEPGVGGVQVFLVRSSDQANVGETTTASNGAFLFANIPAGSYEVRQLLPSGYTVLSRNNVATSPARHAATPPDAVAKNVSLAEGGAGSASFGINVVRTLSGMVFDDLDANGQPNPDEPGLGGIVVEVRHGETDALVASVTTAGDGIFVVPDLSPGSYSVQHAPIPGFLSPGSPTTTSVTASTAAAVNFGVRATATASGRVFDDADGDGVRDAAEPGVGGARLTLQREGSDGALVAETATDGSFLLTGLETGDWTITIAGLPGFANTTPAALTVNLAGQASLNASFGVQSEVLRLPSITRQPTDLTLAEGGSGQLAAEAQGAGTLEFQWLKDGTPLPGATSATLTFTAAQPSDAADYRLRVRNDYGSTLSDAARVTVTATPSDPYAAWATAEKLPENAKLPGQDADLDGVSNLLEFVLGTPPLTPTPDALPAPVIVTRNGAGFLGYEIRTRVASVTRFVLETSTDLTRWTPVDARRESGETNADGELVRLFDTESLRAHPYRFVRLGVALQDAPSIPATLRVLSGPPVAASFRITVEGDPGRTYALQGSDDLIHWNLLQEVVATAAPVTITDDTLGGARYRFYRAVPR